LRAEVSHLQALKSCLNRAQEASGTELKNFCQLQSWCTYDST